MLTTAIGIGQPLKAPIPAVVKQGGAAVGGGDRRQVTLRVVCIPGGCSAGAGTSRQLTEGIKRLLPLVPGPGRSSSPGSPDRRVQGPRSCRRGVQSAAGFLERRIDSGSGAPAHPQSGWFLPWPL